MITAAAGITNQSVGLRLLRSHRVCLNANRAALSIGGEHDQCVDRVRGGVRSGPSPFHAPERTPLARERLLLEEETASSCGWEEQSDLATTTPDRPAPIASEASSNEGVTIMSSTVQHSNLAARMGRWSASHWKTATFGWLALMIVAFALGGLGRHQAGRPQHRRPRPVGQMDRILDAGFKAAGERERPDSEHERNGWAHPPSTPRSRTSSRASRRSRTSREHSLPAQSGNRWSHRGRRALQARRVRHRG